MTTHEAAMRQALEALNTGLEYAEEKLIEHDQAYNQHPATKAGRGIITSDIQAINAAIEALREALAQTGEK